MRALYCNFNVYLLSKIYNLALKPWLIYKIYSTLSFSSIWNNFTFFLVSNVKSKLGQFTVYSKLCWHVSGADSCNFFQLFSPLFDYALCSISKCECNCYSVKYFLHNIFSPECPSSSSAIKLKLFNIYNLSIILLRLVYF